MIVNRQVKVIEEGPSKITPYNVMFWDPESQELMKIKDGKKIPTTLLKKARRFLEEECIEKTQEGYICKPIKRYNKTTHKINNGCSCQGYNKNGDCCHMIAVRQFKFMEEYNVKKR